jgi:hypothetical protein
MTLMMLTMAIVIPSGSNFRIRSGECQIMPNLASLAGIRTRWQLVHRKPAGKPRTASPLRAGFATYC